jgi:murein DD-endopeptidase MepM/ murein hydrolase activator NlpD
LDVIPNSIVLIFGSLFLKIAITQKARIPTAAKYRLALDSQVSIATLDNQGKLVPELLKYSPPQKYLKGLVIVGYLMAIGSASFALLASMHSVVNEQPGQQASIATASVSPQTPVLSHQEPAGLAVAAVPSSIVKAESPTVVVKKITAIPIVAPLQIDLSAAEPPPSAIAMKSKGVIQPTMVQNSYPADDEFVYPLTTPVPVGSPFGWRVHPVSGKQRLHSGIDFEAPAGAPIVAAIGGQVVKAGWQAGYGKTVVIERAGKLQSLYGHMSEVLVQPGQEVRPGSIIGAVGSTGQSTGPHLHFEMLAPTPTGWVAVDPAAGIQYALNNLQSVQSFQSMIKTAP